MRCWGEKLFHLLKKIYEKLKMGDPITGDLSSSFLLTFLMRIIKLLLIKVRKKLSSQHAFETGYEMAFPEDVGTKPQRGLIFF
jgi:hypothetical protein